MNTYIRYQVCVVMVSFMMWIIGVHVFAGVPPTQLTREDAKLLIEGQGYQDVTIGAIVHGITINGIGSDNMACVLAIARRDGKLVKFEMGDKMLLYDHDIGWFDHEFTGSDRFRSWSTVKGYSEIYAETKSLSDSDIYKLLIGTWNNMNKKGNTITYDNNGSWNDQQPPHTASGTWKIDNGNLHVTVHGDENPYVLEILSISQSSLVYRLANRKQFSPTIFFTR